MGWRRWLNVIGWLVVTPLSLIVGARLFLWDRWWPLVAVNALGPVVLTPTWLVLGLAAWLRHIPLLGLAGAMAVAQVALMVPEVAARRDLPAEVRGAPHLVIFNANVLIGNQDTGGYAAELSQAKPDLVVLQEAPSDFVTSLEDHGALADLPHRIGIDRRDPFAFAVMSRFPLRETRVLERNGRPFAVETTLETPWRAQRVMAVHAIAPFGPNWQEHQRDLAAIRAAAREQPGPLLVAGDLNATWGNRAFRRLLGDGFTDGTAARGHPFQMTWPANHRFPPLMRLDHVLTRNGLVVTDIRLGQGRGSDHRPLIARVALV